jgi:hypothetical protein
MLYNGLSHNLQSPLKGFRRGYVDRRQTAKAARALGPKDKKKAGGEVRDGLVRDSVWFRGWLYGGRLLGRTRPLVFFDTSEPAVAKYETEPAVAFCPSQVPIVGFGNAEEILGHDWIAFVLLVVSSSRLIHQLEISNQPGMLISDRLIERLLFGASD